MILNKLIPLFKVAMEPEVDTELLKVLHSGWIGQGEKVEEFESKIAKRINNDLCLSLSSGTHGITLALRLIDINRGEGGGSVITSPMTCFATNTPAMDNRSEIIWADINDDLNIDPESVREKIRKDTKAILFVHWGGYAADLEELQKISLEYNIPLIEDAAHSFGSYYKNHPIGDCFYSNYGIFSWQAIKNLTCFPPGTRIVNGLFKNRKGGGLGSTPIEEIKVGDIVRTYNEKIGKKENKVVTEVFCRHYSGKMITIKLENSNELKMTEDHPVYIIRNGRRGYLPAKEITVGDKVFQYEYQGLFFRINGIKQRGKTVEELFGEYWHKKRSDKERVSFKDHVRKRIQRYKEVGWDCLVIREKELEDQETLVDKLQNFSVNPKSRAVKIIKILEENYDGKVYNIETKDNHNYFAFGILVHNCVDGGMLFLKDKKDYDEAKLLRWFGISREGPARDLRCRENIIHAGYKFHMNDINAVIGIQNLIRFDEKLSLNQSNAEFYNKELKNVSGIKLVQVQSDRKSSCWLYTIHVEDRTGFARKMGENGIMVSQVHARNDKFTCTEQFKSHLPNLERIDSLYCCIPVGWWVTKSDREFIVDTIRKGW